jgi:predicted enzyme related to lactoylglutathione lyase
MPSPKPNAIDYVEIPSRDLKKTRAFFESLFAWKFTDYGPEYTSFEDGRLSGGFFHSPTVAQTANGSALIVFYSPQLESIRDQAVQLGATITRDIFSFPGGRRFQFTEPGGSEFAIWSDR